MQISATVKKILSNYQDENAGTKSNIARILMHGKTAGTGKVVILPVDQGFEHGPAKSFSANPLSYDPSYHFKLAIEAGLSAYAAPIGMLSSGASEFAWEVPLILKINSSILLKPNKTPPYQAVTASVADALRLGCCAVGFTIYPGSDYSLEMLTEASEIIREAKSFGLAAIVWSYPRGDEISKEGETAIDICAYAAHIACLIGADIVKVKLPTEHVEREKEIYKTIDISTLAKRVEHVKQSCFAGKKIVVFSGGASRSVQEIYHEAEQIKLGGGNGSIIGRNSFTRPKDDALMMLEKITEIYSS